MSAKGAKNWWRAVHVRPRGFERCTAIFGASFACLFWAVQAPCGVASNCKQRHATTPQICTSLDQTLAHLLVSINLDSPNTCRFAGSIKVCCMLTSSVLHVDCVACWLCCMLTGFFWDTVDSFARLFAGFYYMFTGESTSKADKFVNLGSIKILNTPVTQQRSGIRTKRHDLNRNKTPRQQRVQLEGLQGWESWHTYE